MRPPAKVPVTNATVPPNNIIDNEERAIPTVNVLVVNAVPAIPAPAPAPAPTPTAADVRTEFPNTAVVPALVPAWTAILAKAGFVGPEAIMTPPVSPRGIPSTMLKLCEDCCRAVALD
jgi:hypothetical protein